MNLGGNRSGFVQLLSEAHKVFKDLCGAQKLVKEARAYPQHH